jgi:hypothetical protein
MAGRICYHCKQPVDEGEPHDCWTTTESALTDDLSEDLQEAWQRLREEAVALGEQRVYASHKSIMFSRKSCYCFVRPKKQFLEVCLFLGRTVAGPAVRRSAPTSATKIAHTLHIRHRDEVEAPITDWLREAYEWSELAVTVKRSRARPAKKSIKEKPGAVTKAKKKTGAVAKRAR